MVEMGENNLSNLNDEELENVNGGLSSSAGAKAGTATQIHFCIKCNKDTRHNVYSGNRMVCSICGTTPTL